VDVLLLFCACYPWHLLTLLNEEKITGDESGRVVPFSSRPCPKFVRCKIRSRAKSTETERSPIRPPLHSQSAIGCSISRRPAAQLFFLSLRHSGRLWNWVIKNRLRERHGKRAFRAFEGAHSFLQLANPDMTLTKKEKRSRIAPKRLIADCCLLPQPGPCSSLLGAHTKSKP
jgi:hypothetical protein